jgi:hypothetical protein
MKGDGVTKTNEPAMTVTKDQDPRRTDKPGVFLAAIVGGAVGSILCMLALFLFLDSRHQLPPPPIANNVCADEKLAFLREHTFESPDVLVLGSSVAWRSVNSAAISGATGGLRTVNGAFCGLRMNQTAFVGDWLLDRLLSVRSVIVVAAPFDFVGCKTSPTAVFNRDAADDFVFERKWKWTFYFRHFDPVSLARNALSIRAMRSGVDPFLSIVFTKFGDGPMDTDISAPTLVYGELPELDQSCFDALRTFAERLASEGRRLAVVTTPLNPDWKKSFDRDGGLGGRVGRRIVEALQQTDAQYLNGDAGIPMEREAFTDAIHLRWSAATTFSGKFAQALAGYLRPQTSTRAGL